MRTPGDARRWMDDGTRLADRLIAGLTAQDFAQPSALPGWTRAHLVAHLSGNARALMNLAVWAATGVETPMYASAEVRAADIERGSTLGARELLVEFGVSAQGLTDALDRMGEEAWAAQVTTAQGRQVPATEICWLRAREVMVHAVDLDAGVDFADLPPDFLEALREEILAKRGLDDVPHGPLPQVVAWLAGRPYDLPGVDPLDAWL